MNEVKVNLNFFLDASRASGNGKCLIKLNVYHKPYKKRYATNYRLSKEEWEKVNSSNLRDRELKGVKTALDKLKLEAENVAAQIIPFSFVVFEEIFFSEKKVKKSRMLNDWFTEKILRLKGNDQIGTASTYQTTWNSICFFKKNLQIQDVTHNFIRSYERHLEGENKSSTTIGIYLRNLRTIINEAIASGVISRDNYPFKNLEIPTGQNVKKALRDIDINLLLNHQPHSEDHLRALDFWIFSYLCNGINFADIISLKPQNVSGNHLSFYREKTKRTKKKDLRPIKVGLNPRALLIIDKWKNSNPENSYLFPILENGLSAITIKNRCQRFIKWVNKKMSEICLEVGLDVKATTYTARHTFSTVLKRKGIPTSYIKDALGHSSVITTENYLDTFEDDVTLEYANLLTCFT